MRHDANSSIHDLLRYDACLLHSRTSVEFRHEADFTSELYNGCSDDDGVLLIRTALDAFLLSTNGLLWHT